jgi:hypothetical protein
MTPNEFIGQWNAHVEKEFEEWILRTAKNIETRRLIDKV